MKPRAPHRGSGGKAFVEDARDDREERGPEPRPSGSAGGE